MLVEHLGSCKSSFWLEAELGRTLVRGGQDQSDWESQAVVWCIGACTEGNMEVRGVRNSEENGLEEKGGSREEAGALGMERRGQNGEREA